MPMPIKLTVYSGSECLGEHLFERDVIKIGRLPSAHLKLEDAKVSRIHSVIEASGDGTSYAIIDMGSSEGTYVNGQKVAKGAIHDGDEIRLGDLLLVVSMESVSSKNGGLHHVSDVNSNRRNAGEPLWNASASELAGYAPTGDLRAGGPLDAGLPIPSVVPGPAASPVYESAWGSVPSNLASASVSEDDRALEVKTLWGDTVVDTLNVTDAPEVTLGDEHLINGWGPFQRVVRCDVEIPTKGLSAKRMAFARRLGTTGATYELTIPKAFGGRVERSDGSVVTLEDFLATGGASEAGEVPDTVRYLLQPEETLFLSHRGLVLQVRYVRRTAVVVPPLSKRLDYTWLNALLVAFFIHGVLLVSFLATPTQSMELTDDMLQTRADFIQTQLARQQKRQERNLSTLAKLKQGRAAASARGESGKMGSKESKNQDNRAAPKGRPDDKELAQSALSKLFGAKGGSRSAIFGPGRGLGGELKSALGGLTGAKVGDSSGVGGLGTRGEGPGGGGESLDSVGLGALGTSGFGGGNGGYGEGAGRLGKKLDRDINISSGRPVIMGSLDKEIIRRVIKEHIAQIRYCYELELQRSPGIFGKVATEFVISAEGRVQSTSVTQSTLNNEAVESCMMSKIRTWKFPQPKGGGIVVVRYPFILKANG
jgi:hypothetical protein